MFALKKQPSGTTIRILPQQPNTSRDIDRLDSTNDLSAAKPDKFFEAFGVIGLPLLLAAAISTCWTVWLIVLTIAPNGTANYLMDTEDFDDGRFWLIIDPDPNLTAVNASMLSGIAASYVHVILKMTLWRNSNLRIVPIGPKKREITPMWVSNVPYIGKHLLLARSFWVELTGYYGHNRKFWNVLFKAGDVVVEAVQLHQWLEAGFSTSLCHGYTALIALSCLSQAFFILFPIAHTAFTEVLVDTLFDMTFAVAYPIILLVYSYTAFDLDRALARLYLQVFYPGSFQRQARMQADPTVTTLFRFCFDSLRTLSWSNLVVRIVMNISFSYRLSRLVEVIHQRRKNLRTTSSKLAKLKAQRPVPHWVGALFVVTSVFALTYTTMSIHESKKACDAYPQCVAFAYRWDRHDSCPCLALVDVDRAPKTYEEWIHPIDATPTVKSLTASGDLQVLQLMNRQLKVWPNELQRCVNLQYLSLYYSGVEVIPEWVKNFRKLEFLDFQGKFDEANIVSMPSDMFANMSSLTFIHLGYQPLLRELPSFEGLQNLKSMSLALLYAVQTLPEISPVHKLQQLDLIGMNSLRILPEVAFNKHLENIVVWHAPLCCNGFMSACNISNPVCSGMTQSECLPDADRISPPSQAVVAAQLAMCAKNQLAIPAPVPAQKSDVDVCGGVLYRQCHNGIYQQNDTENGGICINEFFQVIACSSMNPVAVNARRHEIIHGFGIPCNPVEEAWLGCK